MYIEQNSHLISPKPKQNRERKEMEQRQRNKQKYVNNTEELELLYSLPLSLIQEKAENQKTKREETFFTSHFLSSKEKNKQKEGKK